VQDRGRSATLSTMEPSKPRRRRTTRRDTLLGAASVATLVGCGHKGQAGSTNQIGSGGSSGTGGGDPGSGGSPTGVPIPEGGGPNVDPLSCVVRPAQTEGPYFVDENLSRADIRSDPTDGSVKEGVALRLVLGVFRIDGTACAPIAGALVDIWQCDALGVYSDVLDGSGRFDTRGMKFLRGNLTTGQDGTVEFLTIYPGWYAGRTVHIHFKIRIDPSAQQGHEFTSQLYFDESVNDEVFALLPYSTQGARTTMNEQDGIFLQGGSNLMLSVSKEGQGYAGRFNLGLQLA
jgi:protocatechuate 3,4-dioxygenase beta subunit